MSETSNIHPLLLPLLVGLVCIYPYFSKLLHFRISYSEYAVQISKLLRAKNLERAKKLASVLDIPILLATRAVLQALLSGLEYEAVSTGDYRTGAVDRSPQAVLTKLRSIHDETFRKAAATLLWRRLLALVGAGIIATTHILGRDSSIPLWITLASAFVLFVFLYLLHIDAQHERSRTLVFDAFSQELYQTALDHAAPSAK